MPESARFRLAPGTATLETFEAQLREALAHLYDPDYRPSPLLAAAAGCDVRAGALAVQSALVRAIEQLRPADETPALARTTRNYQLLRNRFVLKLTVEETADRMVMSPSSVRRSQREAVHWLARYLWEQYCAREQTVEEWGSDRNQEEPALARQVQIERDLASLQVDTPGLVARIADAVEAAVRLERIVAERSGVRLTVQPIADEISAAVHPSALRQILVMMLGQLVSYAPGAQVVISADAQQGQVVVLLAVRPGDAQVSGAHAAHGISSPPPETSFVEDLLRAYGGSVTLERGGAGPVVRLVLPAVVGRTVLVVDDNPDMAYFYQRCVQGTPYRIVYESRVERLWETIASCAPDAIVLDIMLPHVDGWDVLANLRHHPATQAIPVLVASVVREEKLAMALGAARCLHKPLSHREFIEALDSVLGHPSPASAESPAHTRPAG